MKIKVLCPQCQTVNAVDPERAGQPVCGRCRAELEPKAPGYPVAVTDSTFETEVVRAGIPVLVDCWAPWCGPCRAMEPDLAEAARQLAGSVRIAKLNTQENPLTAQRLGIRGIPTLIIYRGIECGRLSGRLSSDQIIAFTRRFVNAGR